MVIGRGRMGNDIEVGGLDAGWEMKRATKRGKNANLCHLVIFFSVISENEKEVENGKKQCNVR